MKLSKRLILTICVLTSILYGQEYTKSDSMEVCKITKDFYSWYIDCTNNIKSNDCSPEFMEDKNGMTTLDFERYISNLKKFNFSNSLIEKEKLSYNNCIKKLKEVKYSHFLKFELDEIESLGCDFNNAYRWTGGQDPWKSMRIINVKFNSADSCAISIEKTFYIDENGNSIWGNAGEVFLIKINDSWKIFKIGDLW